MEEVVRTSRNKTYKYIRSLLMKKKRVQYGEFTVEGIKSAADALNSGAEITRTVVSETLFSELGKELPSGGELTVVDDNLFPVLCDTKTPQGIITVVKMRKKEPLSAYITDTAGAYIYCDNVSDPGNLGTVIRTADAANFSGVLLSPDCAELYSPKTVRACMGSLFHINAVTDVAYDDLELFTEHGYGLFCGMLSDDCVPYTEADFTKPSVIVIGNEANGVSERIAAMCRHIKIPMPGKAESLNAAVAGAIMMYELHRQRHTAEKGGTGL